MLTNDILFEYQEIIAQKANPIIATNVAELLINLPNVTRVEVYFNRNLMENDLSDNKFVDAALTGDADCIVSNDSHFNVLSAIEFPKVYVVSAEHFVRLIEEKKPGKP